MSLPIVDMLTGDEVQEAIVRFVQERKDISPDELKGAVVQLSYRNVRFPDGTVSLFATVGIFPGQKKKDAVRPTMDTPIPVEKKDG